MKIYLLKRARRDLSEIWQYIATDDAKAADKQQDELLKAISRLAAQPGMGHRRSDVNDPRYQFWRVGSYLIAYRTHGNTLTVCRVVHGARDFRKLF